MTSIRVSTGDMNCRYLAAPQSAELSQFGGELKKVGVKLPANLSLRTVATRGWLRPRLRVAIPVAALQSWTTFPSYPIAGEEHCPPSDLWGLEVWTNATCTFPDRDTPPEKLWMHWLDDLDDATTLLARRHALDPTRDPELAAFNHVRDGRKVRPWIDFFAHWQVYHAAELVRSAVVTLHGLTDQFRSWDTYLREHAQEFDQNAQQLAALWENWGSFFDVVGCYRTIMARCCKRESFAKDVRAGARAFATQRGIDAVLLRVWQRWADAPPVAGPDLMLSLQYDIQCAVRLWSDLSGAPVDPFDPFWFSKSRGRGDSAKLIDALPHEEWIARRDFARQAVHYQRDFPQPYPMGESQFADLLAKHWEACPPLRRFCLAWVRLHDQLQSRDAERQADQTIAANERIEQFNLIGLHTERLLRHVHAEIDKPEPEIKPIVRAAVERSVRRAAKSHLNAAGKRFSELLDETKLHQQRSADDLTIPSSAVGAGSTAADQLVAAHLNALILRNYAAHHDYLDDDLIYPSHDEAKPHAGATLLSSCLLVVVAALVSLGSRQPKSP